MQHPKFFRKLPFFKQSWDRLIDVSHALYAFFQRQIDEHEKNIDFGSDAQPTDYVEAFLKEKAKKDAEGGEHFYT